MRYIYLWLWIVLLFSIVIVYFQVMTGPPAFRNASAPFFASNIDSVPFMFYMIVMSFFSWVLLTLWIKWILDSSKDLDDWFDL